MGRIDEAMTELTTALGANPNDVELLNTLMQYHWQAGHRAAALQYARRLAMFLPDDRSLQQFIRELQQ